MAVKIQIRRGTAAEWTAANPILSSGEQGLETDTKRTKLGDGVTNWNNLVYEAPPLIMSNTQPSITTNGAIWIDTDSDVPLLNPAEYAPTASPTFTGVLSVPDGSASAPSITNTGDTDTGLSFPAANAVQVSTAGTARVYVDASGNVGVGTTAPSFPVHVSNSVERARQLMDGFVTSANGNAILFRRARGTNSAPTAIEANDQIFVLAGRGHDGSGFNAYDRVSVSGNAGETHTSTNQGTFLTVNTTPNGSTTLTERFRIDGNGLITGTGTSLGAWTAYTPTLGGTGWAIGNGTITGAYCQIGKIVHFRVQVTFGNTSTFGGVTPTVTLPGGAQEIAQSSVAIRARFFDMSLGNVYEGIVRHTDSNTINLRYFGTSALNTDVTSTAPFTWADTDIVRIAGTYQA